MFSLSWTQSAFYPISYTTVKYLLEMLLITLIFNKVKVKRRGTRHNV